MKGTAPVRRGAAIILGALVAIGPAPARADVGRIEGEWRGGGGGIGLTIGAKGFGWAFRGSLGKGWAQDSLFPRTVELYFDTAPCWIGVTMSADESRMRLRLLLALDRRCARLDGWYDRIAD